MSASRPQKKRWYWVCAAFAVLLILPVTLAWVGWKIAGSNLGIAGKAPGSAVVGELADAKLRSMEQWCTGVVTTSRDVWLVSRNEMRADSQDELDYIPADALRLGMAEGKAGSGPSFFGSRSYLTTLARLEGVGSFRVVATVAVLACLDVSPESETLYLFTWLARPDTPVVTDARGREIRQHMVFRSSDHGESWEWLEAGFMADAARSGSQLRPIFASDQDVWLWGEDANRDASLLWGAAEAEAEAEAGQEATSLFHSPDGGLTSSRLFSPEPLEATTDDLLSITGLSTPDTLQRASHDAKRFVVQLDDTRAFAWVGESMWYRSEDDQAKRLMVTSRAALVRRGPEEPWQVSEVRRTPGGLLKHVVTAGGQTHGVLVEDQGEWLVRLDAVSGEWTDRQPLPRLLPGWLAGNGMGARYFWSNGDYQVVSLWGNLVVPRIVFPFTEEPAVFTTDAHFYTRDGGRSWSQLAIPGYLGVMGLAGHGREVFWTKGDWYWNEEPYVWSYSLP